jgi:hypothetical protein
MNKERKTMKCDKCKKIKAVIEYKGGNYCTWYCVKKKKVELPEEFFHDINGRLKELHDFDEAVNGMGIYADTYK